MDRRMNVKDIYYFIEVAANESLTYAAERIGISQPSLSISMKRLEQEVGTTLLFRFKTGVKLTPAGKVLLAHAKQLVHDWTHIKHSAHEANHDIAGMIQIGCHAAIANYHLPPAFFQLLKDQKKLNVHFMHGLSREINEAIITMKIDMGIVVNPTYHPDLVIIHLHSDKVGFWHAGIPVNTQELTLICDMQLKQAQELIQGLKSKAQISRIIESNQFEVLAKLAREGVGVVILPESIARSPLNTHLAPLFPELYYQDEICIVYRNENRFIKSISAIVESIKRIS